MDGNSISNVVIGVHATHYHINFLYVFLTFVLVCVAVKLYDLTYSARSEILSVLCLIGSAVGAIGAIVMVFHLMDNSFGNDDHATFDNFAKNFKNATGYELLGDDALRDTFTMNATTDADRVAFSASAYKGTHIVNCNFTNITNVKDKRNMRFIVNCK